MKPCGIDTQLCHLRSKADGGGLVWSYMDKQHHLLTRGGGAGEGAGRVVWTCPGGLGRVVRVMLGLCGCVWGGGLRPSAPHTEAEGENG